MSYSRAANIKATRKKMKECFLMKEPFEWTEKQSSFLKYMIAKDTKAVMIDGPAGTGKTVLSVYAALQHLQGGLINKIFYIRSVVESTHNKMGFLPGSIDDKLAPFGEILQDALKKFLTEEEIKNMLRNNVIETIPLSFLRGRDLQNCVVIADETQNMYDDEIFTVATRLGSNEYGEHSKLYLLGDTLQSDLPEKHKADFKKFINLFDDEESRNFGIYAFKFTEDDIKRSDFVKYVVKKLQVYRKLDS